MNGYALKLTISRRFSNLNREKSVVSKNDCQIFTLKTVFACCRSWKKNSNMSLKALFCYSLFILLVPVIHISANSDIPSEIKIWPGSAPGSESLDIELAVNDRDSADGLRNRAVSSVIDPSLEVIKPANPNGSSVVICPGGGYGYLAYDKEGIDIGKMLAQSGITAFVLSYRLPAEGHENGSWVPLQDAQRAIRKVRANAAAWGLDPHKIGIMGFSAGGHLASTLGTHFKKTCYQPIDAVDVVCARPDFMVLIYPVVSMDPAVTHLGSRTRLIGEEPSYSMEKEFSNALQVDEKTPPTFFALASNDGAVVPENSIQLFQALLKAGVPVEFHSFEDGGHGFGLRHTPGSTRYWPDLLVAWLQNRGF